MGYSPWGCKESDTLKRQHTHIYSASEVALVVKNPHANVGDAGDMGSVPGWGRSPGGGRGNPLQYSCLEEPSRL